MIQTIKSFVEVVLPPKENGLILLDVDHTIVMPADALFHPACKDTLINDLKESYQHPQDEKSGENKDLYEKLLSSWRAQRTIKLVEKDWPSFVEEVKKAHMVLALTQMDVGALGAIKCLSTWRYEELKKYGFTFSTPLGRDSIPLLFSEISVCGEYFQGILMTGKLKKSQALSVFLDLLHKKGIPSPSFIVFVDDRKDHVEDLSHFCAEKNIEFYGYVYEGAAQHSFTENEDLFHFQKQHFLHHYQWLSDTQAQKMLPIARKI